MPTMTAIPRNSSVGIYSSVSALFLAVIGMGCEALSEAPTIPRNEQQVQSLLLGGDPILPEPVRDQPRPGAMIVDVLASAGYDVADQDYGYEPSIAVNPINVDEIVITTTLAPSGWPNGPYSLWYSINGGRNWELVDSIPPPPGVSVIGPLNQTSDFGADGKLYFTAMTAPALRNALEFNVYTGQTSDPSMASAWTWDEVSGIAQPTNPMALGEAEQPWLKTGRDPHNAAQNVYVAYMDTSGLPPAVRVSASLDVSVDPPSFPAAHDQPVSTLGATDFTTNVPGTRISVGSDGKVYSLFGESSSTGTPGLHNMTYIVNQSTNAGVTWAVNGGNAVGGGLVVGTGESNQSPGFKLGGNNALPGSMTAIGVDPNTHVVYAVYGTRDASHINRIRLKKLVHDGSGGFVPGPERTISPDGVDAALPGVTVLDSGEVGVLFTTYHTNSNRWAVLFVVSDNAFATISSTETLASFDNFVDGPLAPADGAPGQRILGDYQQLKSVGNRYYAAFAARGLTGLNIDSIDPFFFTRRGTAPSAIRACCLPDNSCMNLAPASCRSLDGAPQRAGRDCNSTACH